MKNHKDPDLATNRKAIESSLMQLASAAPKLLEPLKSVTPEQRDAIVMLGLLIRGLSIAQQSPVSIKAALRERLRSAINQAAKPLGTLAASGNPCRSALTDYAVAVAKCDEEGKTEAECPDSWGPLSASVACTMKEIELTRKIIAGLLTNQRPPKPVPWPTRSTADEPPVR